MTPGRLAGRGLSRREWVQRMVAGAGAGLTAPAMGAAQTHLDPSPALQSAPVENPSAEWKPVFLDDYQNQTLTAMAERIVPGSKGAQVNRFLDTALAAETQESQQKFIASLNALEGESLRRFTQSFRDLSAAQQDEVLTLASTGQPSNPSLPVTAEGGPEKHPRLPSLRDYFDHLKQWISMAYYSSEVGMKDLGWTGENFYESFPGCEQTGEHSS